MNENKTAVMFTACPYRWAHLGRIHPSGGTEWRAGDL